MASINKVGIVINNEILVIWHFMPITERVLRGKVNYYDLQRVVVIAEVRYKNEIRHF